MTGLSRAMIDTMVDQVEMVARSAMPLYEVVVWKDDGRGWVRVGGPGPREAMNVIWRTARDIALAQGHKAQVWIRTVEE